MAKITLDNLAHSYLPNPTSEDDFALKELNHDWVDGEAYALLGSSGCGKSTLLNTISGLLHPSQGRILFDGKDVTQTTTAQRNIAQVFQFPVGYDTMTVHDNLAFPLRNRGREESYVASRVQEIARMIGMEDMLGKKARGLTADAKQKISLGRGMVRKDVNALLFDEPLTVIDPHMKWELRTQLKKLHHDFGHTMIYVTHDQTEALTFADKVVVMYDGRVVQIGTPEEIILNPADGYVADFVAGISKLNMIFAHSVMQPVGEFESAYGSVPGDAKVAHPEMDLSDLMNLAVDGHGIVTVADAGNTVGVINRVPQKGETRSNMHVGGRAEATELTDREREICARIGPSLRERGFILVGIDVIGDWLTEINVTSPTGIQELERFDGINVAARIWEAIEAKL